LTTSSSDRLTILPTAASHIAAAGPDHDVAPIFAALGHETRLRLLTRLSLDGPQSIARLTAGGRLTRQAVTKHLQVLAENGLARGSRLGRESLWTLDPRPLQAARDRIDHISAQWDQALGRLKDFVER
jgi:DNA-binding transcriptional ArsR family regulator